MLTIRGLKAKYGDLKVLFDVEIDVKDGEIVTVLGPNGAGKTTILKCIAGLLPSEGSIHLDNRPIHGVPAHQIARRGVALVSEQMNLFTQMTVAENLAMGARAARYRPSASDNSAGVFDLFPRLYERREQQAGTMSGGERRMLALGRALMSNPRLILIDEPSLGLDPKMSVTVFGAIRALPDRGYTVLLVEQNVHAALDLATSAYVLERGVITDSGPAAELSKQPSIKRAYMGMA